MKFNFLLSRDILSYTLLIFFNIGFVQADSLTTNSVEIFYDNIINLKHMQMLNSKKELYNHSQSPKVIEKKLHENSDESQIVGKDNTTIHKDIYKEEIHFPQEADQLIRPPIFVEEEQDIFEPKNLLSNFPVNEMQAQIAKIKENTLKEEERIKIFQQKLNKRNLENKSTKPAKVINKKLNKQIAQKAVQKSQPLIPEKTESPPLVEIEIPVTNKNEESNKVEALTIIDNNTLPAETLDIKNSIDNNVIQNFDSQSIENLEVLSDEAIPTIDLKNEDSFEEKLTKIKSQEKEFLENEIKPNQSQDQPAQPKNWKNYIPFFKNKPTDKPEIQNIPNNQHNRNENLPVLPENNIENNLDKEIQIYEEDSSLNKTDSNLSLSFNFNKENLDENDKKKLDHLIITAKPSRKSLKIIGYNSDKDKNNKRLALKRVINIRQYLIQNGFPTDLITVQVLPEDYQTGKFAGIVNFFLLANNG